MSDRSPDKRESMEQMECRHRAERMATAQEPITARYVRLERQYVELQEAVFTRSHEREKRSSNPYLPLPSASAPSTTPRSDRCEACGYTESHDPNCPRPRDVPEPTEEMVEAGAKVITSLVASHIIEAPRLLEWQPWAGAARSILRAAKA
jgi:hypothetical protein